ncbi:MAG: RNA repair transcriptional activator RtcR family protein [Verrucomicrobia bacterium]|nr:RNA repair transcriptional activator RtcR family protein [Verrucomicrobiota bacterium]
MKILLTFTGFHDPFAEGAIDGEMETGPVLTAISERPFDRVYLFTTPTTAEISSKTKVELEKRNKGVIVEICEVPLKDPTNYLGILKQLRSQFKEISKHNPDAEYFICVSSGTPHMHASWLMLAASGEIPARILQTRAAKFVHEGRGRVTEIDFNNPQFPQIKPFGPLPEDSEFRDFQSLCAELGIIGNHDLFLQQLKTSFTIAEYDSPILLLGETGAGKEVFARLIHYASKRAGNSFVTVNCAAFAETLIESQLFGHRKGAFTGADRDHKGCFEEADGGTLFLDELGEMPTQCQAKLLRAIQYGKIQRLGDSKESTVNVRVVAATNVDLKRAIEEKTLRRDLYYRFGAMISIPALRDRRNDIPMLAHHFLERWNQKHQKQRRLSQQAIIALMKHPWPGNVRELEGVVVRSAQLCSGKVIEPENLLFDEVLTSSGLDALPEPQEGFVLNDFLSEVRGRLIEKAMKRSDRNRTQAASLLGITPQAVSQYLKSRE